MGTNFDLTRLNRKDRRAFGKQIKHSIPGRNLPFQKKSHISVENFMALRAKEEKDEQ